MSADRSADGMPGGTLNVTRRPSSSTTTTSQPSPRRASVRTELGRHDEALAHYRALLELNPGDNQGVRYLLLATLLQLGLNDDAGVLLSEHEDNRQALWPYGRLLWRFRVNGPTVRTRTAFDAILANPCVVSYLL
jgi:hypothetical protein